MIASRKIAVRRTPPRAFEHVMALISTATSDHGRRLHAWDALHAVVAADWASTTGEPVEILTSDGDFEVILEITGLASALQVSNLDILAHTGEGEDRPTKSQH